MPHFSALRHDPQSGLKVVASAMRLSRSLCGSAAPPALAYDYAVAATITTNISFREGLDGKL